MDMLSGEYECYKAEISIYKLLNDINTGKVSTLLGEVAIGAFCVLIFPPFSSNLSSACSVEQFQFDVCLRFMFFFFSRLVGCLFPHASGWQISHPVRLLVFLQRAETSVLALHIGELRMESKSR